MIASSNPTQGAVDKGTHGGGKPKLRVLARVSSPLSFSESPTLFKNRGLLAKISKAFCLEYSRERRLLLHDLDGCIQNAVMSPAVAQIHTNGGRCCRDRRC